MRPLHIILLAICLGVVLLASWIFSIVSTVSRLVFDYKFHDFKFDAIQILNELATTKRIIIDSYITLTITNPTWLSITVKNIDLELYYKDILFVKLLKEGDDAFILTKGGISTFDKHINVFINKETYPILPKYFAKQPIQLKYRFSGTIYGVRVKHEDDYIYQP